MQVINLAKAQSAQRISNIFRTAIPDFPLGPWRLCESKRLFWSWLLLAVFFAPGVSVTLAGDPVSDEFGSRGVVHTVFMWLKQPGNEDHRSRLVSATDRLRDIPGVLEIRFGAPVESGRAIVDDSFDVGVYFYFSDVEAMNRYLVHPLHRSLVEQAITPLVDRIVVHDFEDTIVR